MSFRSIDMKTYSGIVTVYFRINAEDDIDLKDQIYESVLQDGMEIKKIYVDEEEPYEEYEDNYGN